MHTPRTAPRLRRASQGFTLVEVLISILVFSFGLLGAAALQSVAVQMGTQNADRSRAAVLANEMVSLLWAKQTATLTSTDPDLIAWKAKVSNAQGSGLPNGVGALAACTGTTVSNCATVTITWKAVSAKATANSNQYTTNVVIQ